MSVKMPFEPPKKDSGKSISDRLGINKNNDKNTLDDLTNNDGSEDPGSGLDTEFSDSTKSVGNVTTAQTSGTPPKGEELDAFTNNASKKVRIEKTHPKP